LAIVFDSSEAINIAPEDIEIWFADEPSIRHSKALRAPEPLAHSARIGQKNKITRR
jgi:hypothetical protein